MMPEKVSEVCLINIIKRLFKRSDVYVRFLLSFCFILDHCFMVIQLKGRKCKIQFGEDLRRGRKTSENCGFKGTY